MEKTRKTKNSLKHFLPYLVLSILFAILIFVLPACNNESEVITPPSAENTTVGFYTEGEQDNHSIQITEAKFIIKNMTLKRDGGEDDCNLRLGPFIVKLDPVQRMAIGVIGYIPDGNYDAIKFHVHKPSPNEDIGDPDFIESNNRRYSVVVKGYYNGQFFIYKSKLNVVKKIDFETYPVSLTSEQAIFLTIRVNPYSWFFKHGNFLDPENEHNHHEIDNNIKNSLKRAFRDMNRDGEPD